MDGDDKTQGQHQDGQKQEQHQDPNAAPIDPRFPPPKPAEPVDPDKKHDALASPNEPPGSDVTPVEHEAPAEPEKRYGEAYPGPDPEEPVEPPKEAAQADHDVDPDEMEEEIEEAEDDGDVETVPKAKSPHRGSTPKVLPKRKR